LNPHESGWPDGAVRTIAPWLARFPALALQTGGAPLACDAGGACDTGQPLRPLQAALADGPGLAPLAARSGEADRAG
jgi:hypothetical protein